MKSVLCAFVVLILSQTSMGARPAKELSWDEVEAASVADPNPKIPDARREAWRKTNVQRVFGKPKTTQFSGYAKIISVEKKDGSWVITAERGLTEAQEIRKRVNQIAPPDNTVGSFSAAALSSGGGGKKFYDRKPHVTWTTADKPKIHKGEKANIAGAIVDATWTDKIITASLDSDSVKVKPEER